MHATESNKHIKNQAFNQLALDSIQTKASFFQIWGFWFLSFKN